MSVTYVTWLCVCSLFYSFMNGHFCDAFKISCPFISEDNTTLLRHSVRICLKNFIVKASQNLTSVLTI